MGTQRESLTLRWADCGPDLSKIDQQDLNSRIQEHGEIAVRYAAIYCESIMPDEEWPASLETLDEALRERWRSDRATQAIANRVNGDDSPIRIPWLDRYVHRPTPRQCEIMNWLCEFSASNEGLVNASNLGEFSPLVCPPETLELVSAQMFQPLCGVHPDFVYQNAVAWLSYVVNGASDPVTAKAFKRYRPDLAIANHRDYVESWYERFGNHCN